MNFCDTSCLFCNESNCVPVNYSGYHKVCANHIKDLRSQRKATCKKCKSKLIVIQNLFSCMHSNDSSNEILQCGHIGCFLCPGPCKVCQMPKSSTKSCFSMQGNSVLTCGCGENLKKCVDCPNLFCTNCEADRERCQTCKKILQTLLQYHDCSNCERRVMDLVEKPCGHQVCPGCSNNPCKICMSISVPCPNCNSLVAEFQNKNCTHNRCMYCINGACQMCAKQSPISFFCINCHMPNACNTLPCNHKICDNCSSKNTSCLNCFQKSQNFCITCQKYSSDFLKLPCEHFLCLSCSQNSDKCSKCKICRICNVLSKSYSLIGCIHALCFECNKKNQKNECPICKIPEKKKNICIYCKKVGKSITNCQHCICEKCWKVRNYCYICRKEKENEICSWCSGYEFLYKRNDCDHKICKSCIVSNKECKKCRVCEICNFPKELQNARCGHLVCFKCIGTNQICKNCNRNPEQSLTRCSFCLENQEEGAKMACNHYACLKCLGLEQPCFTCSNAENNKTCGVCNSVKRKFMSTPCGHFVCIECGERGNYCNECKNIQLSCSDCRMFSNEVVSLSCGHYSCRNCMNATRACKECRMKVTTYH